MSSIISESRVRGGSDRQRGQVLVIFAGGLVLIIAVAALVFDIGQALLDRRTEQNAADAAALAGARYIPTTTGTFQGTCASRTSGQLADAQLKHVNTACDVATAYLSAEGMAATVTVKYPPGPESIFSNLEGNIEVQIDATRASFFAGLFGITARNTGALGVASNSSGYSLPYSLLALNPCGTSSVTGNGGVAVNGSVQVDSACNPALKISGGGTLQSPECDTVGSYQISGGGSGCSVMSSGMQASGDPLRELPPPAVPATLGSFIKEPGESKDPPSGCPSGGSSTSATSPLTCTFNASFATHNYRMTPGYYPGGFKLNAGNFYMEPGIYYIGGGGVSMGGNGVMVVTVDSGTQTYGGGVLLYNGEFADPSYCVGGTGAGCVGTMTFNGSSAGTKLMPIQDTIYKNMLIFGARTTGGDITLNGSSTDLLLNGTIYAPNSSITVNGSGATSLSVQVIASDFKVTGAGGTLTVTYDAGGVFQLAGVGLVQ
ncbi:MAG: hypothetical protein HYX57_03465 [Chloroflexi bacterium]|nr:hypothetical protein [Chloroflexota bacterium]